MLRLGYVLGLCAFLCAANFGAAGDALGETDEKVLRGRVQELRDAVRRCKERMGKEDVECQVRTRWNNSVVSLDEALDIANELEPKPGAWVQDYSVAVERLSCRTVYRCVPQSTMMRSSSTRVVSTPSEGVFGVCSAAGEANPGDCNSCLTKPPTRACTWHLER